MKVYIQGPSYYQMTADVFRKFGYEIVKSIPDSDVVVLTGGADISPGIYGQRNVASSCNPERDEVDKRAISLGLKGDKYLVGICRGAQLLNCYPNGGKLWQDVDHHNGTHSALDHDTGKTIPSLLSVHHQMMRIGPKGKLVTSSWASTYKLDDQGSISSAGETPHGDPETIWYEDTKSLAFQSHPEFGHPESASYFFEIMGRYGMGAK